MSLSAAASVVRIAGCCVSPSSQKNKAFASTFSIPLYHPRRRSWSTLVVATSASGDSNETAGGTATSAEDEVRQESIEAPDVVPSLISALNVERALRGIPITDVDHYAMLGLPRRCPYDQVGPAYEAKVAALEGQGLDEDELKEKLKLLKDSYTILSSVEERRLYDWSLARSENPDRYAWPFEPDITQTPTQPPPPPEPEDVGPTRLVGYGFLAWVLLSWVLSVALNL
ncbi:hypothetical protein MLD38_006987 [Melastoma candidum]|uniref:Uncharacterized protein n=1 Tax=Melastoma candidum TaxID=119954 RepID=A0ACB9RPM0_9MYRT|nr:hypothetical protein MLD38_006987 [Melastoma candidum]